MWFGGRWMMGIFLSVHSLGLVWTFFFFNDLAA